MIRLCAFADEASKEVEGQIAALKKHNIGYIELRGLDGRNIHKLTAEEAERYAAKFAEAGIRVWAIGSPIGKIDIDGDWEEHKLRLVHLCRLAKIFGTEKIRIFSFFQAYDREETVMARLEEMVAIAREGGCTLYHENEKQIFGDTLERVEKIMDRVPGLKFVYDPANFIEVGEEPEKTLAALPKRCSYFHIKDALMETQEIVPAGKGDGRIGELIAQLPADQNFTLTLEPHLKLFDGYTQIDTTELKNKYCYETSQEAFDAAVCALKGVLKEQGYKECDGGFVKQ